MPCLGGTRVLWMVVGSPHGGALLGFSAGRRLEYRQASLSYLVGLVRYSESLDAGKKQGL